nr:integrase, catalytic region, zinc finger, CCHC-type, peptidase aspartic, catalytic [Tanacetum cinerariifolium]
MMANLLKDIQCAGSNTRPPMLDKTDFASWQQWIRRYCRGKENGANILKSIDEGPFRMGTLREKLTEGTEGALHLGPERPRVYFDLTSEENDRTSSNPKNQATIEDGRVFVQNVQGRQNRGQENNARGIGAAGYVRAQNRVGYANPEYFKDKMLLMQAQENRVALDEEQLLFIVVDDYDAFDTDVNEAPTTQTMFMENLSYADLVYDEVGLSYDLDILSEVHYHDVVCEHHEVHEMHDDVQPNYGVDSHVDYTSDNNMIPYDQELHSVKMQLASTINHNESMVEEVKSLKKDFKQKENKYLEEFLDMKSLKEKVDDKLFKQDQSLQTVHMLCLIEGERGFEQTKECYLTEVIPFFKTLKEHFEGIQKAQTTEIKEMKTIFDELEAKVDQNAVNRKCDEIERKDPFIANDTLIANCLSKEVFYIATNSKLNVSRFSKMHDAYIVVQARCLELETELSELKDKI